MTLSSRPSTAGHFELRIDTHISTAYLKSIDGGHVKTQVIEEPIGPENHRVKHVSVAEIEPISIELGLAGADDVLKWVQDSWRREYSRRSGHIMHADFDMFPVFEHQFHDALLVETAFPTLDGASKEPAYLKVKLQPERIEMDRPKTRQRIQGNMGSKQKLWTPSSFRIRIDGIPEMQYVNKIEAFTIKQGTKKFYSGIDRFPQIEPTKIDFPPIVGTLALHYCDALIAWNKQTNMLGASDPTVQKHGAIEFLGPNKNDVLFRIMLDEVGLSSFQVSASTANVDQIKRAKFELFVGKMDIDGGAKLGLD